jgi:choloylglycine hydrolase
MNTAGFYFVILALVLLTSPKESRACSAFCIQKGSQPCIGRNYDWGFNECLVFINKHGLSKTAFNYYGEAADNPAQWVSKYGSVTFCQYGRENGFVGMNEAGLVVNGLYLSEAVYPAPDSRTSVSMDQWIQYQLDNFSTVDEVINSDKTVRIRTPQGNYSRVHFFVTDRTGKTAVLEHLNGTLVCHTGMSLPVAALTNDTYTNSLAYLAAGVTDSNNTGSLDRFFRAATLVGYYDTSIALGTFADYILSKTEQGSTQYSIIFDPVQLYVVFKSNANRLYRYFTLSSFDLSCRTPAKMLNVETITSGDATSGFVDYTTAANKTLLQHAWTNLGIVINPTGLDYFASYPESCNCTELGIVVDQIKPKQKMESGQPWRNYDILGRLIPALPNAPRGVAEPENGIIISHGKPRLIFTK